MAHSSTNRVALYARTVLNAQAADSEPIVTQLISMREYAAQRGWTIVAEFVDTHANDRSGIRDLLDGIEKQAFDVVLVYTLAALSDSIFDALAIFELLGKHNVGFASAREPQFDLTAPSGRPPLDLIANLGQYYDDLLQCHTQAERQRSGVSLYTVVPHYGYRHDGDPQTPPAIVEEEAEAIRLAFERYAAGKDSYQDIADLLNQSGYRTRRGRRFSKDTVAGMLRDPFYAGKAMHKDQVVPGQHDAIVSEGLWNAALHVRERHHHASRTSQVPPYLLSRIAYCHICGGKLRVQSAAKTHFYREMPGDTDCPNGQTGVRAEALHWQTEAIVRGLQLPPGWQEEAMQAIGDGEETTLRSRRARLIALLRRLKEGYLRGDFEEDEDIYQRELARVRRELEQIPTKEDRYRVYQVSQLLGDLVGAWDEADATDLSDLLQLMLRDVKVDVIQGRLLFLRPYAPFIPLFRSHPLLQERDPGSFAPVWPGELAKLLPYPTLSPLTILPDERASVSLPFLPNWPWEPKPRTRISQPFGVALKARRKAGFEGGIAVAVPQPGAPPVLLDDRKWPDVSLEGLTLAQVLERPGSSVIFLDTPLAVQRHPTPDELARAVFRLLEREGRWHFVDIAPASMPAHWLFAFFPEAWTYLDRFFRGTHEVYTTLRQSGFQVEQQEHTFYQPIALGVALEIARRRPGLLTALPDELYQEGLQRLEEAREKQGDDARVPSEATVVEVMARKQLVIK